MQIEGFLAAEKARVDAALDRLLPGEEVWPQELHRAMRYAVLAGGKRLRPILVRLGFRLAGGDPEEVLEVACAVELIHTYSLVHDDLPAMDNDTLRRGKPTVHVAFGEALAILVGDALLTEGFRLLATYPQGESWASRRSRVCQVVAEAVGSQGMVGGQVEDLRSCRVRGDVQLLQRIHQAKTAAFLAACLQAGALLAGAPEPWVRQLGAFGRRLGLAFQVADDILDVTASAEALGKSAGKDQQQGKLTYPSLMGLEASQRYLQELGQELTALAWELDPQGLLPQLASFVCQRGA